MVKKAEWQNLNDIKTDLNSVDYVSNEHYVLSRLPAKQKEIFIAIAKEGKASGVTSGEFIRKYRLHTHSSVQSAIKYLLEKDLVSQKLNTYQVYDRFLGIWIKQNY